MVTTNIKIVKEKEGGQKNEQMQYSRCSEALLSYLARPLVRITNGELHNVSWQRCRLDMAPVASKAGGGDGSTRRSPAQDDEYPAR